MFSVCRSLESLARMIGPILLYFLSVKSFANFVLIEPVLTQAALLGICVKTAFSYHRERFTSMKDLFRDTLLMEERKREKKKCA